MHMEGNPHFSEANRSEIDEAPYVVAQSNLAIAFELRTANLLKFMELTSGAWAPGSPRDLSKQIVERLGVK